MTDNNGSEEPGVIDHETGMTDNERNEDGDQAYLRNNDADEMIRVGHQRKDTESENNRSEESEHHESAGPESEEDELANVEYSVLGGHTEITLGASEAPSTIDKQSSINQQTAMTRKRDQSLLEMNDRQISPIKSRSPPEYEETILGFNEVNKSMIGDHGGRVRDTPTLNSTFGEGSDIGTLDMDGGNVADAPEVTYNVLLGIQSNTNRNDFLEEETKNDHAESSSQMPLQGSLESNDQSSNTEFVSTGGKNTQLSHGTISQSQQKEHVSNLSEEVFLNSDISDFEKPSSNRDYINRAGKVETKLIESPTLLETIVMEGDKDGSSSAFARLDLGAEGTTTTVKRDAKPPRPRQSELAYLAIRCASSVAIEYEESDRLWYDELNECLIVRTMRKLFTVVPLGVQREGNSVAFKFLARDQTVHDVKLSRNTGSRDPLLIKRDVKGGSARRLDNSPALGVSDRSLDATERSIGQLGSSERSGGVLDRSVGPIAFTGEQDGAAGSSSDITTEEQMSTSRHFSDESSPLLVATQPTSTIEEHQTRNKSDTRATTSQWSHVALVCTQPNEMDRFEAVILDIRSTDKPDLRVRPQSKDARIVKGGFVWLGTTTKGALAFCLVTDKGVESYEVDESAGSVGVRLVSSFPLAVKNVWALASHNLVFCSGIDGDVHPFCFGPSTPAGDKWARIKLDQKQLQAGGGTAMECYGEPLFVLTRSQELWVYHVTKTKCEKRWILRTVPGPIAGVSTIDNLLVVHSEYNSLSLVYDLRSVPIAANFEQTLLPVLHPLALDCSLALPPGSTKTLRPYAETWRFPPPRYVFDAHKKRVWPLVLDLAAACTAFAPISPSDTENIVALAKFLLRRGADAQYAKSVLASLVVDTALLGGDFAKDALPWLKVLAEHALLDVSSKGNVILFSVNDFAELVLDGLFARGMAASSRATFGLEYISSLYAVARARNLDLPRSDSLPVFSRTAQALHEADRLVELYQLVLLLAVPDCEETLEAFRPPARVMPEMTQVALDSLHRMNRVVEEIERLLEGDGFIRAVKLAVARNLLVNDSVVISLLRGCKNRVERFCLLHEALKKDLIGREWLEGKVRSVPDVRVPREVRKAFGLGESSLPPSPMNRSFLDV